MKNTKMDTAALIRQPVDVFIKQLTYLPFKDVISICSSHPILRERCMEYNNKWRPLIENTFGFLEDYPQKLREIQAQINTTGYNYLVYTQLINLLDPVTQLIIYYRQNDQESFNDPKFSDKERVAALFLLNKPEELEKYGNLAANYLLVLSHDHNLGLINEVLGDMAEFGNIRGVEMMIARGADINHGESFPLYMAAKNRRFEMVKFLIERGAVVDDLNIQENAIKGAVIGGDLRIVKYLVERGANLFPAADNLLPLAIGENNLHLLPYLESQGLVITPGRATEAFITAADRDRLSVLKFLDKLEGIDQQTLSRALARARSIDVFRYLLDKGAQYFPSPYALSNAITGAPPEFLEFLLKNYQWSLSKINQALVFASRFGKLRQVEILLDAGADIHYDRDVALSFAVQENNLPMVKLLVERGANVHADDRIIAIARVNQYQEVYDYLSSLP